MDDLFGDVAQPSAPAAPTAADGKPAWHRQAQIDYYGEPVLDMPVPPGGHTAATIRVTLLALLAEAKAATVFTWSPQKLRAYTASATHMAEWLKHGEGDALMAEYKAEMDRLGAPDDQTAPNWQRFWGLAG